MGRTIEISAELRRAGVAASTIRDALRPWIEQERDRIIAELAGSQADLDTLVKIKADATAYFHLKRQLELTMNQGGVQVEKV